MFAVRPPAAIESSSVSALIILSDCGMLPALFGPAVGHLLEYLQHQSANPYCRENTLVTTEAPEGPVIGALVGSRAEVTRRANLHTAALLFKWYGPRVLIRFARLARAGVALRDLDQSDFYLSHIAVLPEHRGRGAGRELLLAGEARARQQGARRCVLDVEEHNDGALSFYARLEYRRTSILTIDLGRGGVFTFQRLARCF
jgi:ribosomal protein S18 acetylase RimI-like enzyme